MFPISDMIVRSICGYVFMIPALILYFLWLRKNGKGQKPFHIAALFLFCYYLFGVLTVTGIGYTRLRGFAPNISLIPLLDMITGPVDTVLNIILFIPLGFLLPLLYRKFQNAKRIVLTGFLFSLSIEIVQMFGWGATDINDLLTNTAGACTGYWIYGLLLRGLNKDLKRKFQARKVNERQEVFLLIVNTFAVMISLQPWAIHELLNIR